MAKVIQLEKNGALKKSCVGFSWTTFFFGFFVPLFRGDAMWFIVMLILNICTLCVAQLILSFLYNSIYTKNLLRDGYKPADSYSENILRRRGYIL
ncbi:HrgC protein [Fusobacterium necrophorum subsp. funduliforme]|uniref:HrgC protein n=6 Tax=Fusobacterium necrophorum TaxID=859 RepID=A0A4Q2KYZ6_9FUSO|nr:hypothetical protein [Fusobacterium necrophorum]AVQ21702.1 HrgC protein [Fusobacterium necrophorum subsp. funduliforme]AYV93187.1 HrgC protein [Fusobacterium necrophorum subsp. funduliforme]AYV95320.1 HrgC protein [Fusobacterium necrophorum subsp. funduliforme]AYZ74650.1 HrgC protein [Fusobacterium necrophorum]AZW09464.1 HrgC protein [Fusobacterium necrophorum subsp. necrophorum]